MQTSIHVFMLHTRYCCIAAAALMLWSLQEVQQAAVDLVGGEASLTRALPGMLEVLPDGISKGKALAHVAHLQGFAMQSVLAMGDGENDISMLSSVGV